MRLVNLTPHPIAIYAQGADHKSTPLMVLPPSGDVARIGSVDLGWTTWVDANNRLFPITHQEYGRINGLPPSSDDIQYVVSLVVALAAQGRSDLLAPYGEVRNDEGTMVGCYALQRIC